MQAVILASDPCFDLKPITDHVPKSLIRIGTKKIIEHALTQLPDRISEIIITVGNFGDQIIGYCGGSYNQRRIVYVKQKKFSGAAEALQACKEVLANRFLVVPTDGIFAKKDLDHCLNYDQCLLAREVKGKTEGERIILDTNGYLKGVISGIHAKNKSLMSTGLGVLTRAFFNYAPASKEKNCLSLSGTLALAARHFPIPVLRSEYYLSIKELSELKRAEKILKNGLSKDGSC
ncbi:MAG: sugar phosphate nucleotidyltransferase [Patescibacteria group bacterium]|jgi:NDP-sugar pyrophosphorylase family protein